jgi:hypothetical protein
MEAFYNLSGDRELLMSGLRKFYSIGNFLLKNGKNNRPLFQNQLEFISVDVQ